MRCEEKRNWRYIGRRWCHDRPHGPCVWCEKITHERSVFPDIKTGRRRLQFICYECLGWEEEVDRLRAIRTKYDWTRPIPDQFPGFTRTTIKNFIESGKEEVVMPKVGIDKISQLNNSLGSLGLSDEIYAEQRSNYVVLRRVNAGKR